jgi:hypothetical protein
LLGLAGVWRVCVLPLLAGAQRDNLRLFGQLQS